LGTSKGWNGMRVWQRPGQALGRWAKLRYRQGIQSSVASLLLLTDEGSSHAFDR